MVEKKGQIKIIAKNIKGIAKGEILEEAKYIKNIAGGKFIQKGFLGGVNNGKNRERNPLLELRVVKVEGPFDEEKNKVRIIEKNRKYSYKITQFNREPKENELKKIKWGIKYDDGKMKYLENVSNTGITEIFLKVLDNNEFTKIQLYAFLKSPNDDVSVSTYLNHIELIITDEVIGYTIMRLFDIADDFKTTMIKNKFPAYIVNVYKVEIRYYEGNNILNYGSFGVTRDGWQKIDEKDGKYIMINRAFEPKDSKKNVYKAVHSFVPYQYKGLVKIDAFELHSFQGKSNLPAEPIYTNYKLDNKTPIPHQRKKIDEITNVNIHIGGHYTRGQTMTKSITVQHSSPTTFAPIGTSHKLEELGVRWLGGSLGCFAFVEDEDIKQDFQSAMIAHYNKEYKFHSSNVSWRNVVNKIHKLEKEKKTNIIIRVIKRENYQKAITDFEPKNILWE